MFVPLDELRYGYGLVEANVGSDVVTRRHHMW